MPRIMIDEDSDMPEVVNTESKQKSWAKKLAAEHLGSSPKRRISLPPFQGSYSRTVMLQLQDGRNVVLQFRVELLNIAPFTTAKEILGPVIPDVKRLPCQELEDAGVKVYYMNRLPGEIWYRGEKTAQGRIKINKSLGRLFSKGYIADESSVAVEDVLRPRLQNLLASPLPELARFKGDLERLSLKLDEFAQLPLWLAHADLSESNVLVDENHEITGVIDWEESKNLQFGVGFGRLHSKTGDFHQGKFFIEPEFEEAERGFWEEILKGMSEPIRAQIEKRMELVQDAVRLGTLLDALTQVDGDIGWTGPTLNALPTFLTYRLPALRGEERAYDNPDVYAGIP
ncbi:hypothetical protein F5Y17DRAFT_412731 [Xylariaceae sp. FL0594]|nr:hypothetical protein F5Y17DRAFT_412731 [Xylariaceae sp. FL0594]